MRSETAGVTVIIPTFNRAAYIAASLESIFGQTGPPEQVIVVNDGSTDDTQAVLRPFLSRITYIEKENGGKPAAINTALPHVTGDYIWIFDDDDIACEDALARHVETLRRHPRAGFTFGHSYHCSSHPDTGILCIRHERRIPWFEEGDDFFRLLMSSYVASPAVLVRTSLQMAAGPYQEGLDRSEDFEIAIRWSLRAPAVRTIGDQPTYFRRFHDGLRGSADNRFAYAENMPRSRMAERDILRSHAHEIPLNRYLPRAQWDTPLDQWSRQRALFRRLTVQMRKGMWEEALEDLYSLSADGFSTDNLDEEQETLAWKTFPDVHSVADLNESTVAGELRDVINRPGFHGLRAIWGKRLQRLLQNQVATEGLRPALPVATAYQRLLGTSRLGGLVVDELAMRAKQTLRRG